MADTPLRPDADPTEAWRRIHEVADRSAYAVQDLLRTIFGTIVALADWTEIEAAFAYHDAARAMAGLRLYHYARALEALRPQLEAVSRDAVAVTLPVVGDAIRGDGAAPDPTRLAMAGDAAHEQTRALWLPFVAYMTGYTSQVLRWIVERLMPMPGSPADKIAVLQAAVGLNGPQARALVRRMDALTTDGVAWRRVVLIARRQAERMTVQRAQVMARTESLRWATRAEVEVFRATVGGSREWELEWLTIIDDRTCPVCIPLDGTRVPVGAEFYSEVEGDVVGLPPIHSDCRCRVVLVHNGTYVRQVAPARP